MTAPHCHSRWVGGAWGAMAPRPSWQPAPHRRSRSVGGAYGEVRGGPLPAPHCHSRSVGGAWEGRVPDRAGGLCSTEKCQVGQVSQPPGSYRVTLACACVCNMATALCEFRLQTPGSSETVKPGVKPSGFQGCLMSPNCVWGRLESHSVSSHHSVNSAPPAGLTQIRREQYGGLHGRCTGTETQHGSGAPAGSASSGSSGNSVSSVSSVLQRAMCTS